MVVNFLQSKEKYELMGSPPTAACQTATTLEERSWQSELLFSVDNWIVEGNFDICVINLGEALFHKFVRDHCF